MANRRSISWVWMVAIIAAGMLTGLLAGLLLAVGRDLPQVQALEDFEPSAATRIWSADGQILGEFFVLKRLPLPLEEVPDVLAQAIIAVEDRRFYKHPGMDIIRTVGALISDIQAGALVEGASTITQQLARNLFLTRRKTLARKLKEIFLAVQIERRYTKAEILGFYLNQVYFGAGAYGIGAASETYFGKPVSALTLDETALLAGLLKSPLQYNPARHPDRAVARRQLVLQAMVREGYITADQAAGAAESPLRLAARDQTPDRAPYFVEYVRNSLLDLFGQNAVYKGGLQVKTTLSWKVQAAAEASLARGLAAIDRDRIGAGGGDPERPQAALVAMETGTGRLLAWVGGRDFNESPFDRVDQAKRQPGSAFKPFIYAAAVEGGATQADRIWDAPISYRLDGQEEPWRPQNYNRRFEGEITLRRALEISGNIPAIKLLSRVGVSNVTLLARKLGIVSALVDNLTLALGTSEVSLLELTGAYNGLASGGLWPEPQAIEEVRDQSDRVIYRNKAHRRVALSPESAFIVTDMLRGVVNAGTAQSAAILQRPVAGKTGTTDDFRDALFLGYTPEMVAGVWVGLDSNQSLGPAQTGAKAALPIWIDFMGQALKDRPVQEFRRPINVVMAPMDPLTGLYAPPGVSGAVTAAFKSGTEPRP